VRGRWPPDALFIAAAPPLQGRRCALALSVFREETVSKCHIAQLNIATLLGSIDSPQLSDFVANLDRINALADDSPGFVWRLQTEDGDATGIDYFGSDKIVNLSVVRQAWRVAP
jgi:hypothetical protein